MAFTTIAKSSDHFDCPTWAGSGSTTTITGMGFKPDSLLIKNYSGTGHPVWNNSTQGIAKNWLPSGQNAYDTNDYIQTYTSDGFTLKGGENSTNVGGSNFVAACWKANGGTTSSNSDGSITSTVQANTTAGFSVVTYTGTGSNATIGHGLGVAPKIIFTKPNVADYGATGNGSTIYVTDPWTDYMEVANAGGNLNDNAVFWNDTAPTTSVFSVGTFDHTNKASTEIVAYCFAEVQGFSKFGYYSGTGNAQGTKVYCGFRPKWVLIHSTTTGDDWFAMVSGLTGYGVGGQRTRMVRYNTNTGQTSATMQFESNGFRMASTSTGNNQENTKYYYMAFAEMPMVGTNGTIALAI